MSDQSFPLRSVCKLWLEKIKKAEEHKKKHFGDEANDCMRFYAEKHNFMFEEDYNKSSAGCAFTGGAEDRAGVGFRMSTNKVAELVQVMGPHLYQQNPTRVVRPRSQWVPPLSLVAGLPPDPMMAQDPAAVPQYQMAAMQYQMAVQQYQASLMQRASQAEVQAARCQLLELYLNYVPTETNLRESMRLLIIEALIKGRGIAWTEVYQPPGSAIRIVGSFHGTVNDLLVDPDAELLQDAKWIARRCCHPVWEVEEEYELKKGSLKGNLESLGRQVEVDSGSHADGPYSRKRGESNDLIVYWKVWSKMGLGGRLRGAEENLAETLDQFGDYAYLAVASDVAYPLNLPPELVDQVSATQDEAAAQDMLSRLDWPIPFWKDDAWPFEELDFHPVPNCSWPRSTVGFAIGEQKWLNWCYSFLAGKVRNTCRDFVAIMKGAGEEIKQQVLRGGDLALLELEPINKTIDQVVQFLQHPPMNADLLKVLDLVEHNFGRRTGLTETMYAESRLQPRSATEVAQKTQMAAVRPDDMADKVEAFSSKLARKEAIAARILLTSQDVAPILGPEAGYYWDQLVHSQDLDAIVRELDYRIEAGSTRKPNRDLDVQNTNEGVQVLLPILQGWAQQTGQIEPLNAFLDAWARAREMDPAKFRLQPPPPPPVAAAPSPGQEGGTPAPTAA